MDPVTLAAIFGWSGACTTTMTGFPQMVRLLRTKATEGLSPFFWELKLGVDLAWMMHGLLIEKWNMVVPNFLSAIITITVLIMLYKTRQIALWKLLTPGIAVLALMLSIDFGWGSLVFGIVASVPALIGNAGQSADLVRSESVSGVSLGFLLVYNLNQAIWITWAYLVNDPGTIFAGWVTEAVVGFNLIWWLLRRCGVPPLFKKV